MIQYFEMGKKIYGKGKLGNYRRMIVFIIRSLLNHKKMEQSISFFKKNQLLNDISEANPRIYEQLTRQVFYRNSTFTERLNLIREHFLYVNNRFSDEALKSIYLKKMLVIWEEEFQGEKLSLNLSFSAVHTKEGLLAIILKMGSKRIYQVIFWVNKDHNGEDALWIGALQGSVDGLEINRALTKHLFGYRPKNLMLSAIRTIACTLSLKHIYAVSDYGFYANNHIRIDRKLKMSLDEFWEQIEGMQSSDPRFFELPIMETRKSLDEVKSQKRNLYRKRFAAVDKIENEIRCSVKNCLK